MHCHRRTQSDTDRPHPHGPAGPWQRFLRSWIIANSLLAGFFALCWLILRSGTKPSRFAYPCQQAAFSTASLAFGVPLVSAAVAGRKRLVAGLQTRVGIALASVGLFAVAGFYSYHSYASAYNGPRLDPPRDYRAQLYHVTDCPQNPEGESFVGLDQLIALMGNNGLKFYESPTVTPESGPDGIIGTDDVVIVKFNYQWAQRGGTNTDLMRGLIHRIVRHPDGFTGEIVLCENTQFADAANFDRTENNAQDIGQSPQDLVNDYTTLGYNISRKSWRTLRTTRVDEYSDGDMTDGYVVYPYDALLHGAVSYPKFQSNLGTYISVRDGVWDPGTSTYDRENLKFINVPLLKSHHATYGATACVKHYMGVVTDSLGTSSHSAIHYGVLGAQIAEIGLADLNILDCIWINANPYSGPSTSYAGATRRDQLIASVDPVAIDIWAVTNILIPAFLENGYTPPWPSPSADPGNPSSAFRMYLDNSMSWILAAGGLVTNDLGQIDTHTWNATGDLDGDCDVDLSDLAVLLGNYNAGGDVTYHDGDLDQDGDVDLGDLSALLAVYGTSCP